MLLNRKTLTEVYIRYLDSHYEITINHGSLVLYNVLTYKNADHTPLTIQPFKNKQDQMSNRYDSILQWLMVTDRKWLNDHLLTDNHTPNLEMLSHLKIILSSFTTPNKIYV